jgi:hypothetical protein
MNMMSVLFFLLGFLKPFSFSFCLLDFPHGPNSYPTQGVPHKGFHFILDLRYLNVSNTTVYSISAENC